MTYKTKDFRLGPRSTHVDAMRKARKKWKNQVVVGAHLAYVDDRITGKGTFDKFWIVTLKPRKKKTKNRRKK